MPRPRQESAPATRRSRSWSAGSICPTARSPHGSERELTSQDPLAFRGNTPSDTDCRPAVVRSSRWRGGNASSAHVCSSADERDLACYQEMVNVVTGRATKMAPSAVSGPVGTRLAVMTGWPGRWRSQSARRPRAVSARSAPMAVHLCTRKQLRAEAVTEPYHPDRAKHGRWRPCAETRDSTHRSEPFVGHDIRVSAE
jgi:hypothetical protein